jgi:hypothetical protein
MTFLGGKFSVRVRTCICICIGICICVCMCVCLLACVLCFVFCAFCLLCTTEWDTIHDRSILRTRSSVMRHMTSPYLSLASTKTLECTMRTSHIAHGGDAVQREQIPHVIVRHVLPQHR